MPENQSPAAPPRRTIRGWRAAGLFVLLSPILLPVIALAFVAHGLLALALHSAVLLLWLPRGTRVLFVYSDSPLWKDHVENHILPRLPPESVVLNWSERARWSRWSLAGQLFRFHGGSQEFNPLGVVFRPFKPARIYRFWQAFRQAKHGRPEPVEELQAAFFDAMAA